MDGIHDMGGMHGFGCVEIEAGEPVFHAAWEARVFGMVYQAVGFGWATVDAFRHAIERMPPVAYLTAGYYGRWLAGLETALADAGVLGRDAVGARLAGHAMPPPSPPAGLPRPSAGFVRAIAATPRFRPGDAVRARTVHPAGHTRLPRYVRGRCGTVHRLHFACVFPDANAHGRGEDPQHLYSVRFDGAELWGADGEPGLTVHLDLFEPYLEPA